ncbi:MAG TPA: SBBP repeat-containing protein [Kofleriaceae bacterium]
MLAFVAGFALTGCPGRNAVQCAGNGDCDLSTGGTCLLASTGNEWCAYPDPGCPGGYRYSATGVGDGLGGMCVPALTDGGPEAGAEAGAEAGTEAGTEVQPEMRTLTVNVGGSGMGAVTSEPTGFACSSGTCTGSFPVGTQFTLSATASVGTFLGWSDTCVGTGVCVVTLDQDRLVTALFGMPGEALWSTQLGSTGDDIPHAIATDSMGNLIVAGHFSNSITAGGTTITSAGSWDIFVAKIAASDGSVIWLKSFGAAQAEDVAALALDSSDNIYLAGTFAGTPDFGGGALPNAGSTDNFVMKLDSAGGYLWAKGFGGPSGEGATGIAVSSTTVAVAGTYSGSMTVNGTTLTNSGTSQAFIAEFTPGGGGGLVKSFNGSGYTIPGHIALDSGNNIILSGTLSGAADFGGGTVTSSSGDAFLVKLSATGGYLFAKVLGGTSNDSGGGLALDSGDNIFMTGTFSGMVQFGGASPLNTNTLDMALVKYSSAGAYDWAVAYGDASSYVTANGLSVSSAGDLFVTGDFCGHLNFGTIMLASVGTCAANDHEIFAARLSGTDGSPVAAMRAGGSMADSGYAITQTSDFRHYVAASFQGFADFGGAAHTSAGGNDVIVLGLAPL